MNKRELQEMMQEARWQAKKMWQEFLDEFERKPQGMDVQEIMRLLNQQDNQEAPNGPDIYGQSGG